MFKTWLAGVKKETMCSKRIFSTGLIFIWVTVLVIVIDRLTKNWAIAYLTAYEPLKILPIFNLTLAYNKGAAFGFLHTASGWQNGVLGAFSGVVSLIVIAWLANTSRRAYWMNTALTLILGGALGNAWDRVIHGYVTDFLSFHLGTWHFAIFNIADSAISVGGAMLLLHWLMSKQ